MSQSQALQKYDAAIPQTFEAAVEVGKVFAASGFFQDCKLEPQAVAKILAGKELGVPPMAAITGIHLIQGRVSISSGLMATMLKRSGKYNYRVKEMSDKKCVVEFLEGSQVLGESPFTIEDAHRAKLTGKDIWQKYPRNMLFSRALSNGARWFCADIFGGPVYTEEEIESINPGLEDPGREVQAKPMSRNDEVKAAVLEVQVEGVQESPRKAKSKSKAELCEERQEEILELVEQLRSSSLNKQTLSQVQSDAQGVIGRWDPVEMEEFVGYLQRTLEGVSSPSTTQAVAAPKFDQDARRNELSLKVDDLVRKKAIKNIAVWTDRLNQCSEPGHFDGLAIDLEAVEETWHREKTAKE